MCVATQGRSGAWRRRGFPPFLRTDLQPNFAAMQYACLGFFRRPANYMPRGDCRCSHVKERHSSAQSPRSLRAASKDATSHFMAVFPVFAVFAVFAVPPLRHPNLVCHRRSNTTLTCATRQAVLHVLRAPPLCSAVHWTQRLLIQKYLHFRCRTRLQLLSETRDVQRARNVLIR